MWAYSCCAAMSAAATSCASHPHPCCCHPSQRPVGHTAGSVRHCDCVLPQRCSTCSAPIPPDTQPLPTCTPQALGTPCDASWPGCRDLPNFLNFEARVAKPLRQHFPRASEDALDLLGALLQLDPSKRPTGGWLMWAHGRPCIGCGWLDGVNHMPGPLWIWLLYRICCVCASWPKAASGALDSGWMPSFHATRYWPAVM